MGLNLAEIFRQTAARQPQNLALLGPGDSEAITYAQLDQAIDQASTRLTQAGVRPGDCVGLHCRNGASYIVATYAAWRAGASVTPIPVELTSPEKVEILRTIALDYVITPRTSTAFFATHQRGAETEILPGLTLYPLTPLRDRPAGLAALNAAFIRFTSGTTAAAKGVVLSHETIHERIHAANQALQLGPDDRVVWLLSMAYHFTVSIVSYLSFGAGIILPLNHFAQAILRAGRRHGGTMIYGSPSHFAWLAHTDAESHWPELRLAISTTAPIDLPTAHKFRARFGVPVAQALGIIEIGLPFINLDFAAKHPEAIGKLLPAYEVRYEAAGLEDRFREILLRGPGCLDAYYDPWRPRTAIMQDGWFRTGDVAEVDADGCVFLRGRLKEVIDVLGMKFFPQEVEAVLRAHPAVADVCVFPDPDAGMGQTVHAQVVLKPDINPPTKNEMLEHCEHQLAHFKVPRRIDFVTALSRTASGKIIRRNTSQSARSARVASRKSLTSDSEIKLET